MTEAEAWDLLIKALGLFGGLGAIMVAAAGFLSKFMADRSIERHKAELGQETERLKSELSQETETHKFQLKKKEILFTKQIDAAAAYFDLYKSWSPATPIPEKDWHDVLTETVEEFGDMETRLNVYLSVHGVFLSDYNLGILESCAQSASLHRFAISGHAVYTMEESLAAAEDVLEKLKLVKGTFVEELRK